MAKGGFEKSIHKGLKKIQAKSKRFRSLPTFIVIGVMKGGTSSLFYYLQKHPQIIKPLQKELRFFSGNFTPSLSEYQQYFPLQATLRLKARYQKKPVITGEATPNYFFHPSTAMRIARFLPEVKLVVLLRDPVDRAYSHYQHLVKRANLNDSFEDVLKDCMLYYPKILEDHFKDPLDNPQALARYSILERGKYINHLSRWLTYFPREQVKVLASEDFFQRPHVIYQEVIGFLGLSADVRQNFQPYNVNTYDPLKTSTRKWLEDFYRPYNRALVDVLGHSLPWSAIPEGPQKNTYGQV